ncbi:MAG: 2-amino-4-hydroxy-6-hydroxymethyldihydropteridine diphosphokinase [Nitrospinae bacterium]|nr:2-amino-4-hydroxy-6-hydroxymethyldihydropteridine diphosphokinase [Nitrospinota bacterium]
MPHTAYIGIGSNLDAPEKNCAEAIEKLDAHPEISLQAKSSFYKTQPVGPVEQGWFINAAIRVQTTLGPLDLLEALLSIEKEMGRVRGEKWGPRLIDLDLLFYDERVLKQEGLTLPHPEITKRRFVLAPLCDIAENIFHPVLKKTLKDLLEELADDTEVIRLPVKSV